MKLRSRTLSALTTSMLLVGNVACSGNDDTPTPADETPNATSNSGKADIYGDDDRREPWAEDAHPAGLAAMPATAMIMNSGLVISENEDGAKLSDIPMKDRLASQLGGELCEGELFADDPAPGFCSGFLIAPDLIATAGHCVDAGFVRCDSTSIVFGFTAESADSPAPTRIPAENLYHCETVVGHNFDLGEIPQEEVESKEYWYDWAVMKLDRPVEGRTPLVMTAGTPEVGDAVIAIGHPSGVSTKITPGTVMDTSKAKYFNTDLDIYVGNSGSVAVNAEAEILGVVSRGSGGNSFEMTEEGCFASRVCDELSGEDGCVGNHVIRASAFQAFANPDLRWEIQEHALDYAEIPRDNTPLVLETTIEDEGTVDIVTIRLEGHHPRPEELFVTVEHDGTLVDLIDAPRVWDGGSFTMNRTSMNFAGHDLAGTWTVRIHDTRDNLDTGALEAWALTLGARN